MSKLRLEIYAVQGDGRRSRDPLLSRTLDITSVPTSGGDLITVPARPVGTPTSLVLQLTGLGAPAYVDIGPSPDPVAQPTHYVGPGDTFPVDVKPGDKISAVLATDVAAAPGASASAPSFTQDQPIATALTDRSSTFFSGAAQQACAANTSRKLLIVSNPDQTSTFWFNTTGTATAGAGSHAVLPSGAFVFDKVVPSGAVSVIGTSGAPFTVKEA